MIVEEHWEGMGILEIPLFKKIKLVTASKSEFID